jgi:hypothetical protein
MSVAFTEIWQNLIDKWESLLEAEFSPTPVYQSDVWENVGTESIRLSDGTTEREGGIAKRGTRFYTANLTYYLKMKPGRDRLEQIRKAFDRINAVVNVNCTPSGTYVFHDWMVLESIINDEPLEGEPDLMSTGNVRMILQATVTEVVN